MKRKIYDYDTICEELQTRGCFNELQTTREEFIELKSNQGTCGLYTKMKFRCRNCGNVLWKSLASIKVSSRPWLCKSCSQSEGANSLRKDYCECIALLQEKGFVPLFDVSDISTVAQKVKCIGSCGHIICTTLAAMLSSKTSMCLSCTRHIHDGENNYNWKGGYEDKRIKFRKTFAFKQFVKDVLKRDNYTCQICGIGSKGAKIVVHHKDGYNWCVHRRVDVDNGITLCEDCHKKFHKTFGAGYNTELQYLMFADMCKDGIV